ncbi:hypothetical protein ACKLNO_06545 [Neisseriaceae bacterium B1]
MYFVGWATCCPRRYFRQPENYSVIKQRGNKLPTLPLIVFRQPENNFAYFRLPEKIKHDKFKTLFRHFIGNHTCRV